MVVNLNCWDLLSTETQYARTGANSEDWEELDHADDEYEQAGTRHYETFRKQLFCANCDSYHQPGFCYHVSSVASVTSQPGMNSI
jgi:hypothetical protein